MDIRGLCVFTALVFLFVPSPAFPEDKEAQALKKFIEKSRIEHDNPHIKLGCPACHGTSDVMKAADGTVPLAVPGGVSKLCYSCHGSYSNIHPVDVVPSMQAPAHLPLYEGKLSCDTCHDMHQKKTKDHLLRGFAEGRYLMRPDLCIDCHGESFVKKNPHFNQKERGLCVFCHQTEPQKMDTDKTVRFRFGILRSCNFCHNLAGRNHPVNVDRDVAPPKSLPRDIDGSVTCATCHDPHGTADTLHFLKREYIKTVEASRSFNPHKNDCPACHAKMPKKGQATCEVIEELRYEGSVDLLCNSCHGTHSVHPVNIFPGPGMVIPKSLPLGCDGKINCITCHDVSNCKEGKLRLRLFNEQDGSMRRLCFSCHDEQKFAKYNPHKDISSGEDCLFCHERQPYKGDSASTVSFISSLGMICLRCHESYPHPAGLDHMRPPRMEVPADLPLDHAGQVTCITCHNPHIDAQKKKTADEMDRRLRRPGDRLCDACHVAKY
ncbi:MAG TPA: cytochrome c3 family protein [Nitrospirota bacterium]|nr:cytochrome c3 family protein [Nitrospirota bacterium]